MRNYLQWSFWIIGLTLQYLVTAALLVGPYKEFRAIFVYTICLLVTTILDICLLTFDAGLVRTVQRQYYWTADLLRYSALYCVVISLVMHAFAGNRKRGSLVRLLTVLAIAVWIGTLVVHREPNMNKWMVHVVRDLSFASAIANLVLWFSLIASEKRDARLLTITGGLGLQWTGEAIGQSLRQISQNSEMVGVIVMVAAHFLCLYIWWRAFSDHSVASSYRPPGIVSLLQI